MSDEKYIKRQYIKHIGMPLNLDNPKTFNEKLQWLKLYWHDPILTKYSDKYAVRELVARQIGESYVNELYGVYDTVKAIDFHSLPNAFILKVNHGSGQNIICKDKSTLNIKKTKSQLNRWMKQNHYFQGREWCYKNIEPKIICEKYLGDELIDYKFFCFNGEPKYIFVCSEREIQVKADFYDLEWNKLPFKWKYPLSNRDLIKPKGLKEMINLSRKLSSNFPFSRIDFYEVDNKVIFGEITFYHGNGNGNFEPGEYDTILGELITLPKKYESPPLKDYSFRARV